MTIDDVAREAGVSTATVSRVMNHHSVREKTRQRVLRAVAKLKWEPNINARGLMSGTAGRVGVVIPSFTNPYFTEIVEAIEGALSQSGYLAVLASTGDRDEERERRVIASLIKGQVDGIIVADGTYGNNRNGYFTSLAETLPLVVINGQPDQGGVDLVMTDQAEGMRRVLDFLYSQGHGDIAFFMAEKEASGETKWRAFREWYAEKNLPLKEDRLVRFGDINRSSLMARMEEETCRWISRFDGPSSDRPTAVFACNDLIALGVLAGLEKAGLTVPEDMSLVGHDNTPYASLVRPKLTTVEMKMTLLGRTAARRMVEMIEGEGREPQRIYFTPQLIVRDSTAPLNRHELIKK